MDVEERELLRQNLKLSEENNKMIRRLYRAHRWGQIAKTFYWLVIIALTVGAYYYIQPYIKQLQTVYAELGNQIGAIKDIGSAIGNFGKKSE